MKLLQSTTEALYVNDLTTGSSIIGDVLTKDDQVYELSTENEITALVFEDECGQGNARLLSAAFNSYNKHCGDRAIECAEGDLLGELLQSLRESLQVMNHSEMRARQTWQQRARNVIAKAVGKQSPQDELTAGELERKASVPQHMLNLALDDPNVRRGIDDYIRGNMSYKDACESMIGSLSRLRRALLDAIQDLQTRAEGASNLATSEEQV